MNDAYRKTAVEAALAGGNVLAANVGRLKRSDVRRKGGVDWVTRIDHLSEERILRVIRRRFPGDAIVAEESAPAASVCDRQWFVDPLDGTVNFIHGFPMFCVSIGFAHKGVLQVGAIYDPLRKELFTASRGQGAYLNKKRISVIAGGAGLQGVLVTTGFPFRASRQIDLYLESFRRVFMKTGTIRRAGSAALDLAYTACGRAGGFWEMALSPWDMAAGALLIQEAGGRVSNFFGGPSYLSDGHIAAGSRVVHKELVRILTPVFRGKLAGGR
ncbi:MAG: inositol monophosphatase [Candidatus Omnitrophica bacterium]|nr:inositol monophosphatase [Candidatus Omnitrophota bacterium]